METLMLLRNNIMLQTAVSGGWV